MQGKFLMNYHCLKLSLEKLGGGSVKAQSFLKYFIQLLQANVRDIEFYRPGMSEVYLLVINGIWKVQRLASLIFEVEAGLCNCEKILQLLNLQSTKSYERL